MPATYLSIDQLPDSLQQKAVQYAAYYGLNPEDVFLRAELEGEEVKGAKFVKRPSAVEAAAKSLVAELVPTAVGALATIGTAPLLGPVSIGPGAGAGMATSAGLRKLLEKIAPDIAEQLETAEALRPISSIVGGAASVLGIQRQLGVQAAKQLAKTKSLSGAAKALVREAGGGKQLAQQLAIPAAIGAGVEMGRQYYFTGNPVENPSLTAANAIANALFGGGKFRYGLQDVMERRIISRAVKSGTLPQSAVSQATPPAATPASTPVASVQGMTVPERVAAAYVDIQSGMKPEDAIAKYNITGVKYDEERFKRIAAGVQAQKERALKEQEKYSVADFVGDDGVLSITNILKKRPDMSEVKATQLFKELARDANAVSDTSARHARLFEEGWHPWPDGVWRRVSPPNDFDSKVAQVDELIKSGVPEKDAIAKAGLPDNFKHQPGATLAVPQPEPPPPKPQVKTEDLLENGILTVAGIQRKLGLKYEEAIELFKQHYVNAPKIGVQSAEAAKIKALDEFELRGDILVRKPLLVADEVEKVVKALPREARKAGKEIKKIVDKTVPTKEVSKAKAKEASTTEAKETSPSKVKEVSTEAGAPVVPVKAEKKSDAVPIKVEVAQVTAPPAKATPAKSVPVKVEALPAVEVTSIPVETPTRVAKSEVQVKKGAQEAPKVEAPVKQEVPTKQEVAAKQETPPKQETSPKQAASKAKTPKVETPVKQETKAEATTQSALAEAAMQQTAKDLAAKLGAEADAIVEDLFKRTNAIIAAPPEFAKYLTLRLSQFILTRLSGLDIKAGVKALTPGDVVRAWNGALSFTVNNVRVIDRFGDLVRERFAKMYGLESTRTNDIMAEQLDRLTSAYELGIDEVYVPVYEAMHEKFPLPTPIEVLNEYLKSGIKPHSMYVDLRKARTQREKAINWQIVPERFASMRSIRLLPTATEKVSQRFVYKLESNDIPKDMALAPHEYAGEYAKLFASKMGLDDAMAEQLREDSIITVSKYGYTDQAAINKVVSRHYERLVKERERNPVASFDEDVDDEDFTISEKIADPKSAGELSRIRSHVHSYLQDRYGLIEADMLTDAVMSYVNGPLGDYEVNHLIDFVVVKLGFRPRIEAAQNYIASVIKDKGVLRYELEEIHRRVGELIFSRVHVSKKDINDIIKEVVMETPVPQNIRMAIEQLVKHETLNYGPMSLSFYDVYNKVNDLTSKFANGVWLQRARTEKDLVVLLSDFFKSVGETRYDMQTIARVLQYVGEGQIPPDLSRLLRVHKTEHDTTGSGFISVLNRLFLHRIPTELPRKLLRRILSDPLVGDKTTGEIKPVVVLKDSSFFGQPDATPGELLVFDPETMTTRTISANNIVHFGEPTSRFATRNGVNYDVIADHGDTISVKSPLGRLETFKKSEVKIVEAGGYTYYQGKVYRILDISDGIARLQAAGDEVLRVPASEIARTPNTVGRYVSDDSRYATLDDVRKDLDALKSPYGHLEVRETATLVHKEGIPVFVKEKYPYVSRGEYLLRLPLGIRKDVVHQLLNSPMFYPVVYNGRVLYRIGNEDFYEPLHGTIITAQSETAEKLDKLLARMSKIPEGHAVFRGRNGVVQYGEVVGRVGDDYVIKVENERTRLAVFGKLGSRILPGVEYFLVPRGQIEASYKVGIVPELQLKFKGKPATVEDALKAPPRAEDTLTGYMADDLPLSTLHHPATPDYVIIPDSDVNVRPREKKQSVQVGEIIKQVYVPKSSKKFGSTLILQDKQIELWRLPNGEFGLGFNNYDKPIPNSGIFVYKKRKYSYGTSYVNGRYLFVLWDHDKRKAYNITHLLASRYGTNTGRLQEISYKVKPSSHYSYDFMGRLHRKLPNGQYELHHNRFTQGGFLDLSGVYELLQSGVRGVGRAALRLTQSLGRGALEKLESMRPAEANAIRLAGLRFRNTYNLLVNRFDHPIDRVLSENSYTHSEIERVTQHMDMLEEFGTSVYDLTPKEQKLVDAVQESLMLSASEPNRPLIMGRTLKPIEHYVPASMLDREVREILLKGGPEAEKYREMYRAYYEGKTGTREGADETLDALLGKTILGNTYSAPFFGPVRRAHGIGLPAAMRVKSIVERMYRFNQRTAADLAYHNAVERDPAVGYIFGHTNDGEGHPYFEGGSERPVTDMDKLKVSIDGQTVENLTGHPDFEPIRNEFGLVLNAEPNTIETITALVNAARLGVITRIRDVFTSSAILARWVHAEDIPQLKQAVYNVIHGPIDKGFSREKHAQDFFTVEDTARKNLVKLADILRKYQGADLSEKLVRNVVGEFGELVARAHYRRYKETGQESDILQLVPRWKELPEDELVRLAGQALSEQVSGNYSFDYLPKHLLRSHRGDFLRLVFSLQRWAFERARRFRVEVLKPMAEKGDITPLVKYTIGHVITGVALDQLLDMITGYTPSATITEAVKGAANGYYKLAVNTLANKFTLMGFAGIYSTIIENGISIATGEPVFPMQNPAYGFVESFISRLVAAMNSGEDIVNSLMMLGVETLTDEIQTLRVAKRAITYDKDLSEAMRLQRVLKLMEPGVRPSVETVSQVSRISAPARLRMAGTPAEAMEMLPAMVNYYKMRQPENATAIRRTYFEPDEVVKLQRIGINVGERMNQRMFGLTQTKRYVSKLAHQLALPQGPSEIDQFGGFR